MAVKDRPELDAALTGALDDGRDADVEVRIRIPDTGRFMRCAIAARVLTDADGAPAGAVLCIDDVTEAAELRAELERQATTDELTGCLNRAAMLAAIGRSLGQYSAGSPGTAVVFLDLDGFKNVNDTFGHKAGDLLLASTARRLRRAMRAEDILGRLGGDEFIVVLPNVGTLELAEQIGLRLAEAVADPPEWVSGLTMRIRASIGVAWASREDVDADTLTAAADRAMYESKRAGNCEPVYASI